jgi:hypothetical protein
MTINLHNLKPGQTLELTIRKITRGHVFFKQTNKPMPMDVLQIRIHETQQANQRSWDALRSVFATQYTIPPDIDLRDVADAAEALGITEQFRKAVNNLVTTP